VPVLCQKHEEHHGHEQQRDHRQDRQVSHRCFHDWLLGTTTVSWTPRARGGLPR
jgi:hypothetical protein